MIVDPTTGRIEAIYPYGEVEDINSERLLDLVIRGASEYGTAADRPCRDASELRRTIVLRNAGGVVAVFNAVPGGLIRVPHDEN